MKATAIKKRGPAIAGHAMRFTDILQTAFMNLWRRKLRAFLTVLGMVIGTTSIVVMVSLGIGIQKATVEMYAGTGSLTLIRVNTYKMVESGSGNARSVSYEETSVKLDDKAVKKFQAISGVKNVMPMITAYGILKSGNYITDAQILAIDAENAADFGIELESGEYPRYTGGSKYEIVMASYSYENFYNPQNGKQAVDREGNPKITEKSRFQLTFDYSAVYGGESYDQNGNQIPPGKSYRVTPVGKMSSESNDFSWYCLMDMQAVKKLAQENKTFMNLDTSNYQQIYVKCDSLEDVSAVKAAIDDMGYGTYSLQDAVDAAEQSTQQIQYLLGAIGAVSLLVAAIGIMNTMMMSIYERTKEIGIMKVLGCRMGNIAALFLSEAAFIGFFGGALGLGLSYSLSALLNKFIGSSGFQSVIPAYLALGALAFSVVVALISGFYPALRAMKLSPLNAIRAE